MNRLLPRWQQWSKLKYVSEIFKRNHMYRLSRGL